MQNHVISDKYSDKVDDPKMIVFDWSRQTIILDWSGQNIYFYLVGRFCQSDQTKQYFCTISRAKLRDLLDSTARSVTINTDQKNIVGLLMRL